MTILGDTPSRRSLLKAGAVFAVSAPAIIPSLARAEDDVIYVNTWGGAFTADQKASFFDPFTAKTGIRIRTTEPVSIPKLKAQVQSGNYEFDITTFDLPKTKSAMHEGLTEPIDFSVVNKENIAPGAIVGDGIASQAVGTCLAYWRSKFPGGGPRNWADFWDVKKFPGTRSLMDQPYSAISFALMADGVAPDKIYPPDLDRAFRKLDEIKPHIKVWYKEGAQAATLLGDGEVDIIPIWNGRAQELIDAGKPIELVWNGAQLYMAYWLVAKGTPRARNAWRFIEFAVQGKPQADYCIRLPYGPSNPKAFDFMTPEQVARVPTAPDHLKVAYWDDADWLGEHMPALQERWSQWLAS